MSFNLDTSKQGQKVIFSKKKKKKECYPTFAFNNNNVSETNSQKHLGMGLGNHLPFEDHSKMV